jgi:hypothetical protein
MSQSAAANDVDFIFPQNDQAVRANNGNVTIELFINVPFKLKLDGGDVKLLNYDLGARFLTFKNLDRGTHTLEVITETGISTLTFHVLRVHI